MNKKTFYLLLLIFGAVLVSGGIFIRPAELKAVSGVFLGIGAGLCGMSVSKLYMCHVEKMNPQIKRQNDIEFKDERNTLIRNRAKAKAGDITQWLIIGLTYVMIVIGSPLWVTLITILIFLAYNILAVFFSVRFQKEM